MKITALALAAISILQLAAARPYGERHAHARDLALDKRETVVVWVDQYGNVIDPPSSVPTAPGPPPPPAPTPSQPPAPGSNPRTDSGITYSPYHADHTCKSQDEVNSDIGKISGYSFIRLYGVDCDQVTKVLNAAKPKGIKVFAGIFDIAQVDAQVQTLIAAAKDSWDFIHTVSVGNELVNFGADPGAVIAAVNSARGQLRAAQYNGPVVTVDTFVALINHPELCQASDYAAANCHAFFAGVDAATAGSYVAEQAAAVSKACGGKKTIITETGWPHQGNDKNGNATPSPSDQQAAITSLKNAFSSNPGNLVLFTAFDDMWKTDNSPATFGAEKFWGILT
ncbi:MAG: hypothetical protein M1839_000300 [Geoglossum umbratile]|nr:MAG: hypothetical protein M1839_000300 [Geoglossum umbratile]